MPNRILGILDALTSPSGPYNLRNDSSHLLLLEFFRRGHEVFVADPASLSVRDAAVHVRARPADVLAEAPYFRFRDEVRRPATEFSLILMRKDPPVDAEYLQAVQLLSLIPAPSWVCNDPMALARWNEKLVILQFPDWIPPTCVATEEWSLRAFAGSVGGRILLKSLLGFGGKGVSLADARSPDFPRKVREATEGGRKPVMAQVFLPQVALGEKRIFVVDGRPLGAILRTPPPGGYIANPDLGGRVDPAVLTEREKRLCAALRPFLRKNGIFFAGVDVIGEQMTEINVTSPGLVWEWNRADGASHEREVVDLFEEALQKR